MNVCIAGIYLIVCIITYLITIIAVYIEKNGNDADVGLAAAEAIPDIEHLNKSLSEVLDPTINMSKIRAVTKYLLLLVLVDGVILSSIVVLIFITNHSLMMSYLYTFLEYLDHLEGCIVV